MPHGWSALEGGDKHNTGAPEELIVHVQQILIVQFSAVLEKQGPENGFSLHQTVKEERIQVRKKPETSVECLSHRSQELRGEWGLFQAIAEDAFGQHVESSEDLPFNADWLVVRENISIASCLRGEDRNQQPT